MKPLSDKKSSKSNLITFVNLEKYDNQQMYQHEAITLEEVKDFTKLKIKTQSSLVLSEDHKSISETENPDDGI